MRSIASILLVIAAASSGAARADCTWSARNTVRFYEYGSASSDAQQDRIVLFRFMLNNEMTDAAVFLQGLNLVNLERLISDPPYSTQPDELFLQGSLAPAFSHQQFTEDNRLLVLMDGALADDMTVLNNIYLDLRRYDDAFLADPLRDSFKLDSDTYDEYHDISIAATYTALAIYAARELDPSSCRKIASLLFDKATEILSRLPVQSSSAVALMETIATAQKAMESSR